MNLTDTTGSTDNNSAVLVTALVLFCASGTGIYGSIVAGMTGDHSHHQPGPVDPLSQMHGQPDRRSHDDRTPAMINDFKASGGILLLATGFRMIKVKEFPVADMIPAMALAMPVSYLWTVYIMPLNMQ